MDKMMEGGLQCVSCVGVGGGAVWVVGTGTRVIERRVNGLPSTTSDDEALWPSSQSLSQPFPVFEIDGDSL